MTHPENDPRPDEDAEPQAQQEPVDFGLSDEDLAAIAEGKSKVVPDLPKIGNSAYTIENAPIAKMAMPASFFDVDPPSLEPLLPKEPDEEDDDQSG
jgi:hypothetical protein